MKFKTDENLPVAITDLLRWNGHDAISVVAQNLAGHPDSDIATICKAEHRAIVTQDLDFADVRAFPPRQHFGIIVLRPRLRSVPALMRLMNRAIKMFGNRPLIGQLWIVTEHRIRVWHGS